MSCEKKIDAKFSFFRAQVANNGFVFPMLLQVPINLINVAYKVTLRGQRFACLAKIKNYLGEVGEEL